MQDENKKALVYLAVAIVIVAGWLFVKTRFFSEGARVTNSGEQTQQTPTSTPTQNNTFDAPDGKGGYVMESNGNTRLKVRTTYTNSVLGFSLSLPAGWYVPAETDSDPHFYNCSSFECGMTFVVQSQDGFAEMGFANEMAIAKENNLRPKQIYPIRGARVIKSDADSGFESWNDQYLVIFEREHRGFRILANGYRIESLVLPSFKLVK